MKFTRTCFKGGLILVQLSSALVLFSCTATPLVNVQEVRPALQNTMQASKADAVTENGTPHTIQEDTVSIKSLPRDHFNVDWVRAVKEGYIRPKASIGSDEKEDVLFDLDIFLRFRDPIIKDVLFSHATHTYWLNCDTCHPKIFAPELSGNLMTMKEIQEGKFCGKCHGVVSFPTHAMSGPHFRDFCLKCHKYRDK